MFREIWENLSKYDKLRPSLFIYSCAVQHIIQLSGTIETYSFPKSNGIMINHYYLMMIFKAYKK